jgi:hypothetical protein
VIGPLPVARVLAAIVGALYPSGHGKPAFPQLGSQKTTRVCP